MGDTLIFIGWDSSILSPLRSQGEVSKGETLSMEFQDKILKCVDCGTDFVFTAGEQLFFHDKQFKNEPKRCKRCKEKRAQALGLPQPGGNYQRVETKAVCSGCQRETTVPFKPTQGRPVFCRECFQARKGTAAAAATA
jgi:CxxC-x17-CxxC domain-containing protein